MNAHVAAFTQPLVAAAFFEANQQSTWLQSAIPITQIVISLSQLAIVAFLTYHIFVKGSELKIAERHATWYHKVVVDPQILELRTFFDEALSALMDAARNCASYRRLGDLASFDSSATQAIGIFNSRMLPIRRNLMQVVSGFDQAAASEVGSYLSDLQERISSWFETFRSAREDLAAEDQLTIMLSTCHNTILARLRNLEFEKWGFPHQQSAAAKFWKGYKDAIERLREP